MEQLFDGPAGRAWRYFAEICTIPRGSGEECRIAEWVRGQATAHDWPVLADAVGNLVVRVPGKGALEGALPLILQGHMDMVCEKNDGVAHDFSTDPIRPVIDGDWLVARETTLGADNGVALALALAAAAADLPNRVPLELLFTIDEERGLTGAMGLDVKVLQGRRLLNLDSGNEDIFVIGCAGGVDLRVDFPVTSIPGAAAWRIAIRGLRGGHSGADIHEGRGHAIQLAAALCREIPGLTLHALNGGNKKNAIPREADVIVSGCGQGALESHLNDLFSLLCETDPAATFTIAAESVSTVVSGGVTGFLAAVPIGVIDWHETLPGVVRSSNSIGVATTDGQRFSLLAHGRSSAADCLDRLVADVAILARRNGASFAASSRYPGWQPNRDSDLLALASEIYEQVFAKPPEITAIHAGLEAGIIGDKLGSDELVAFGPTMEGLHAPGERLNIPSFDRVDQFLKALIAGNGG